MTSSPTPFSEADGKGRAAATTRPGSPSVHLRAVATWLAIFPLVSLGLFLLEVVAPGWPPLLQVLVLTLVVVPLAVYLVVPFTVGVLVSVARRSAARATR